MVSGTGSKAWAIFVLAGLAGSLLPATAQASVVVDPFTSNDTGNYTLARTVPTYSTAVTDVFSTNGAGQFQPTVPGSSTYIWMYTGTANSTPLFLTNTGDNISVDVNLSEGAGASGLRIASDAPVTAQSDGAEFALTPSTIANSGVNYTGGAHSGFVTLSVTRQAPSGGNTPYLATVTQSSTVLQTETLTLTGTANAYFGLDVFSGVAAEKNLIFTPVPEPTALGILGLGAIGLLRRRTSNA